MRNRILMMLFVLCLLGMVGVASSAPDTQVEIAQMQAQHAQIIAEQAKLGVHIEEIERRLNTIDAAHVSERLASIEATVTYDNRISLSILGGMFLLVIEKIVSYARKAKPESE
jgi:hypothetical protein